MGLVLSSLGRQVKPIYVGGGVGCTHLIGLTPPRFLTWLKPLTPIRVKGANSTVNCPFFHSLFSDFYQMTLESFDDDGLHYNFN